MNKNIFNTICSTITTAITYLFGGWGTELITLIIFMFLDYGTGALKGYVNKELSSAIGARGIAKKAVIFAVLIIAVSLDRLIGNEQFIFRTLVCYFYIANEAISILENCADLDLPIPDKIKDALIQLRDGENK